MRARIGLEVRAGEVRAVQLDSGALTWHAVATLADPAALADVVYGLLAAAPTRRGFRPRLIVAVCFARAQVKRLSGLPALKARSQMTQLVRENAGLMFLRTASAVAIPDVHRASDGEQWSAAFDQGVVDAVAAGAARCGLRASYLVPTACVLARLYPSTSIFIEDGLTRTLLRTERGQLRDLRRTVEPGSTPAIPEALATLEDDALGYLGAYAAALSARREPLAWKPESSLAAAKVARRTRLTLALSSLAVAGALTLAAPGLHASLFARRSATSHIGAPDPAMETARTEAELRRTTLLLENVAQFAASRGQLTRLLAELTQALPESTAIMTLRVDSAEGSFVAMSPHVTDVLSELGSIEQMIGPRIVGSVTREMVAGARVERAAFRFQRPRAAARAISISHASSSRR